MTDSDIIALYYKRSETAITESQKKYGGYCHSIAKNILCSEEDAEECVNDTWVRAWGALPPARPEFLGAFLGKITRNLSLGLFRKHSAEKRGGGQITLCIDELEEVVSQMDGSAIAEDYIIKDAVNRFLMGLSEKTRNIFLRRYWYVSSIKEIARDYLMSESAVKTSLMRTRNSLREFLDKEGIDL